MIRKASLKFFLWGGSILIFILAGESAQSDCSDGNNMSYDYCENGIHVQPGKEECIQAACGVDPPCGCLWTPGSTPGTGTCTIACCEAECSPKN